MLDAMSVVPRERFVTPQMAEFAYEDSPLPIGEGQTISQPLIVAMMAQAAEIEPGDRVLEVGAGSGYGAAVLGQIASEVWSVERHRLLAEEAHRRMVELGYDNVHVVEGDGTLGWPEAAPFDAIIVTAGGPSIPASLVEQLVEGGRLVIPVGSEMRAQALTRVRLVDDEPIVEELGAVRFVPLIGEHGWETTGRSTVPQDLPPHESEVVNPARRSRVHGVAELVRESAESFASIDDADLGGLLERIGPSTVVLLGEATHGTSEFYRMRDRITRALIERLGFTAVAVEADWPDASLVDRYVRSRPASGHSFEPFARFPTWMWRNAEVTALWHWMRAHNEGLDDTEHHVSFHGLDLYSMFSSRSAVLAYLDEVDPDAAAVARRRYGCLTPWQQDPAAYGRAVVSGRFAGCADGVISVLSEMLRRRMSDAADHGYEYLDATQNAAVVANAERYYRVMYSGSSASWNLRDQHMFETLQTVRAARGAGTKVVVWEHNSHVGDAAATEMGARGELNVGMLCRREFGDDAYLIGFGTHEGVVAAASEWDGPLQFKPVRPSLADSYERLCHDSGDPAFTLHLRDPRRPELRSELDEPRLERAIGVIYRPETELQSHYFQASLPTQFDEYIWFDRTSAVHPFPFPPTAGEDDLFPTGL